MLIIGLTGGIASGKSTVTRALQHEPDIAVIDADRLAWETYQPGSDVYEKLVGHFGNRILNADRTINRRELGARIFQSGADREFVNRTVHPAVMEQLKERARAYEPRGVEILVVEAALLLESESVDRDFFDYYVIVSVDSEEQIRRLMERDGSGRDEALKKIASQTPQAEKLRRADYVLESSGSLKETVQRAKTLIAELRQRVPRRKK